MTRTLSAILAAGLLGASAQAADFVVTNLADSGPGSLRQALLDAGDNDEQDNIRFDDSLSGQIDLGDSLRIRTDLTITGFPEDPGRITIDGGGEDRIFNLGCGDDVVTIEGLTLTHGRTPADDPAGGAILSESCDLTLSDMVITENVADGTFGDAEGGLGGGVAAVVGSNLFVQRSVISGNVAGADRDGVVSTFGSGGGIGALDSHVEIEASRITDNSAIGVGSSLTPFLPGGGGVAGTTSSLVINQSTISGNLTGNRADVGDGPVLAAGGGVMLNCFLCPNGIRIDHSTISGNLAGNSGTSGPVAAWGGGVVAISPILVANSTISGNVVGDHSGTSESSAMGGGVVLLNNDSPAILASSTIAGNQALGADAQGGGIASDDGTGQLHNTIVAGNSAAIGPDARGQFDSFYSIIENQSGMVFESGSATAGSPNLGPLMDNGGPTETHAITNTSLAFNAGDPLDCPETDQRGVDRPQLGVCDIGAFELAAPPVGPTLTEIFDDLVGAGQLTGTGLGRSAARRLNAMRNMTIRSEALIEAGDGELACEVLSSALLKTDGQSPPPDFVQGPGAAALAAAIQDAQGEACL